MGFNFVFAIHLLSVLHVHRLRETCAAVVRWDRTSFLWFPQPAVSLILGEKKTWPRLASVSSAHSRHVVAVQFVDTHCLPACLHFSLATGHSWLSSQVFLSSLRLEPCCDTPCGRVSLPQKLSWLEFPHRSVLARESSHRGLSQWKSRLLLKSM